MTKGCLNLTPLIYKRTCLPNMVSKFFIVAVSAEIEPATFDIMFMLCYISYDTI